MRLGELGELVVEAGAVVVGEALQVAGEVLVELATEVALGVDCRAW